MLIECYLEIIERARRAAINPSAYKIMYHYSGAIDIVEVSTHEFKNTNYYEDVTHESLQRALNIVLSELNDEIGVNLKTI